MVDRRVALMETKDWKEFTLPQTVLETDALDTPVCESYGLTVLPYDNYFLGLYWLFHPNAEQVTGMPGATSGKYFDGYVDAQMTCSENGWYFNEVSVSLFYQTVTLENRTAAVSILVDCAGRQHGSLLVDACIYPFEHGRWREFIHEDGSHRSIGTYRIRKTGFVITRILEEKRSLVRALFCMAAAL